MSFAQQLRGNDKSKTDLAKAGLNRIACRVLDDFLNPNGRTAWVLSGPRSDPFYTDLMDIAMSALSDNRAWEDAKEAVMEKIHDDAVLLWALFEPYRALAVENLLHEAKGELYKYQNRALRANRVRAASERSHNAQEYTTAVITAINATILDTLLIDGVSLGDCTPERARAWASNRKREVRFIELATANLPFGEKIRSWLKPEQAQVLWQSVQEDDNG